MTTSSPADGSAISKCIVCGADISPKTKVCLICGASQMEVVPTSSKVVAWYAAIPGLAKFCEECAASRNRMAAAVQKDESATSTPKAEEVSSSTLEESTVSGIESNASQIPHSPSTAANQISNPAEAGSVDKGSSKQKKLLLFLGIAAVVVVLAWIGWFNAHQ